MHAALGLQFMWLAGGQKSKQEKKEAHKAKRRAKKHDDSSEAAALLNAAPTADALAAVGVKLQQFPSQQLVMQLTQQLVKQLSQQLVLGMALQHKQGLRLMLQLPRVGFGQVRLRVMRRTQQQTETARRAVPVAVKEKKRRWTPQALIR